MTDLPAAAITAAGNAMRLKWQADYPGIIPFGLDPMDWATTALEAAAPHITAAAWHDGYAQGRDDEAAGLPLKEEPAMTSNTPAPIGNHASPGTVLPDPTTETEGFRAYKAGLAAGRTEGTAAERQRLAAVISPDRFRELADWFDDDDAMKMRLFRADPSLPWTWENRTTEWQDDLRRLADLLEDAP